MLSPLNKQGLFLKYMSAAGSFCWSKMRYKKGLHYVHSTFFKVRA